MSETRDDTRTGRAGLLDRRFALKVMGGAGAALAFGCGSDSPTSATAAEPSATSTAGVAESTNALCVETPQETAGPFPSRTDLVRSDIREDRAGTPLTLEIEVVNAASECAPVAGAEVDVWHCDAVGDYSEYGSQSGQTFLRGVQTTDASGRVTFTTVYPGWYQGRATHIHLEVQVGGVSRKVTQIAFPEDVNDAVHRTGVYAARGTNPTRNAADGIFADSLAAELVTPVGDPSGGYAVTFQVTLTA